MPGHRVDQRRLSAAELAHAMDVIGIDVSELAVLTGADIATTTGWVTGAAPVPFFVASLLAALRGRGAKKMALTDARIRAGLESPWRTKGDDDDSE